MADDVAQRFITPETVGLIFALEPFFAAILSFLFLYEILVMRSHIGALMILAGIFMSKIRVTLTRAKSAA